ncbi:MAG: DUF1508 domain-containing protein [Phenylobacterium sp.]|uniref:YegP family protein n=1 Tax=Phenylobacterium sp. TaxID=1871053 RepID=UPI002716997F|nr:DUF1508 domain-containing protein [Phenylobacterium sp.]MDO8900274.1 DUF1508 domain-containing protein [Phenylobacterium sp.]MDP2214981.1 DUF1508 domain-containing protein [Phenylobacterium sp.]
MPKPNAKKADAENPILSDAEIAAMRPARDVLGKAFVDRQMASQRPPENAPYRYEIFRDLAGAFRVRFRTPSGEVLFSTEGFRTRQSAVSAIKTIQDTASSDTIEDVKQTAPL